MINRLIDRFRRRPSINKPVFVVGCARSGTTLLFQLLAAHTNLIATEGYPDGEDHVGWIEHGKAIISGLGDPKINGGHTGYHYCLPMNENDVDESISTAMHDYYIEQVLQGSTNHRVVNKCPHLSNKLRYVRAIFPDAKFVHIVRDCVSVVSSLCKMMEAQAEQLIYWPGRDDACLWILPAPEGLRRGAAFRHIDNIYPGGGVVSLADYWAKTNLNMPAQLPDTPDQLLTVRYEDLCADPAATLGEICSFCELEPFAETPTDKWDRPIYTDFNDKHRSDIDDDLAAALLTRSIEARQIFGYANAGPDTR